MKTIVLEYISDWSSSCTYHKELNPVRSKCLTALTEDRIEYLSLSVAHKTNLVIVIILYSKS